MYILLIQDAFLCAHVPFDILQNYPQCQHFLPCFKAKPLFKRDRTYLRAVLYWTAQIGSEPATKRCLGLKASLNARDLSEVTVLQYDAEYGHLQIEKLVVWSGADLEASEWCGRTPVSCARGEGSGGHKHRYD